MASRNEVVAVYAAGLVQGVALVTFPAASSILTSPSEYGLTSTAYGALFLPQAIAAVSAALAGAGLTRRAGAKRVFLAGLTGDLAAMSLLVLSQLAIGGPLAYLMLLAATTSLGIGFGLTVPTLNNFAAAFFPEAADRAVLFLNALLGLGTALAPVLVAVFLGLGVWWGLPLAVAILTAALILVSRGLPLQVAPASASASTGGASEPSGLPAAFWLFAAFALLYGIVETTSGNWATLYMTGSIGATTAIASVALTTFWAMVTVGRVLFAAIEARFPETNTYRLLPFVAAAALAAASRLTAGEATLGILAFGLAGLGCSALLPLTISFGQRSLIAVGAALSGLLIAAYQLGYGIAAFGYGPLQDQLGIGLGPIFGLAAAIALVMGALSFVIVRRREPVG
jgi:fucose permease